MRIMIFISRLVYKNIIKKILFLINPEIVHQRMVFIGNQLGRFSLIKIILSALFKFKDTSLEQSLFNIRFDNPVGLAAGFDYEARLTQILPAMGFGFGSVGTLTYHPYQGNLRPRLGRLPKSKSLMVNKGFKNLGIKNTLTNLRGYKFSYPVGVSIGMTNTDKYKNSQEGINDIVESFKIAESSEAPFAYYELNISCPNLHASIEFYNPIILNELLTELSLLAIRRPVFIKMPISLSDNEIVSMMKVIVSYPVVRAVILGNLQRDRSNKYLKQEEVAKFSAGNFSGMPCQERSDELISLVYKGFGDKIKIIGCGGVFSAEDAYRKIKLGASLVQLITGLIFEGPQLATDINCQIKKLLARDGFVSVRDAVGAIHRNL